ncbi:MAG: LysR family transcriptional regulator [Christensenellales bacterium]|jgi:DNA-binding transcriptional LysR family regulator
MELYQIRYFIAAAKTGSFKQAANELFISRQAVGQAVRQLENKIGYSLFERTKNGLILTSSGKCFLPKALELINTANKLQHEMIDCANQSLIRLTLGFSYTTYAMYESALSSFVEHLADSVLLSIKFLSEQKCIDLLRENQLDIALTTIPTFETHCRLLAEYPVCLMMSRNNPLSSSPIIELSDLKNETFLAYSSGTETPLYMPDCIRYRLNPKQLIINDDLVYLFRRVQEDRGILISVAENMGNLLNNVVLIPFPAGGTWKHYLSLSSFAATKLSHVSLYQNLFQVLSTPNCSP